ncbi:hypothetical protein PBY51_015204 [Eleginops maclovinus]|uniref:Uncharacterized protein n=1 Tax=Eleginops maclovinus TaxID=56733 RepID=A0AAN7X3V9_ELEMC|nr:hypothetical protein PBY51_015204 [Eleginops maclovinus]
MYFLLSVTTNTPSLYTANQEITGSTGGEITIQCNNEKPTTSKDDTTGLDESNSDSSKLMAYIIPLSLLTFIVLVTVFIWFMLKRHMQIKEAASTTTVVEDEVTYSTIQHKTKTSSQKSPTESADDMTYSSVKATKQQHVPRVEA